MTSGNLCIKGRFGYDFVNRRRRASLARFQILYWQDVPSLMKAFADDGTRGEAAAPEWFQQEIDRRAMAQGLVGSDAYLEAWRWGDVERAGGKPRRGAGRARARADAVSTRKWLPLGLGSHRAPRARRHREPRPPALRRSGTRPNRDILRLRRDDARHLLGRDARRRDLVAPNREEGGQQPAAQEKWNVTSFVVMLIGSLLFAALISRSSFIERLRNLEAQANKNQQPRAGPQALPAEPPNTRQARLRWDEIGVVVALLAGTASCCSRPGRRSAPRGCGVG